MHRRVAIVVHYPAQVKIPTEGRAVLNQDPVVKRDETEVQAVDQRPDAVRREQRGQVVVRHRLLQTAHVVSDRSEHERTHDYSGAFELSVDRNA